MSDVHEAQQKTTRKVLQKHNRMPKEKTRLDPHVTVPLRSFSLQSWSLIFNARSGGFAKIVPGKNLFVTEESLVEALHIQLS